VLNTVVRKQSKKEIGIAEARPANVADEFVTFDYFRGRFPMDLVIHESNKPFEVRVRIRDAVVAFDRQNQFRHGSATVSRCHRNLKLDGVSRTGESKRLGNDRPIRCSTTENQSVLGIAG
jgi:hypothetical protein